MRKGVILGIPLVFFSCLKNKPVEEVFQEGESSSIIALDPSFNGVGYVTHHPSGSMDGSAYGRAITIDSSGRILVAGELAGYYTTYIFVWRFSSNGVLDTSFNGTGYVSFTGPLGVTSACAISVDSQGRIVVAGHYEGKHIFLVRYYANGTLDTSFNGTGYVIFPAGFGSGVLLGGCSMVIDSNGRIVVAGYGDGVSSYDMYLIRYHSNGTLDTSFNGTGYVTFDDNGGTEGPLDMILDSQGRILITGVGSGNMYIWRYLPNGTLDTSFNGKGYVTFNGGVGYSIALDSQERILVTGTVNGTMYTWRYLPDGTLDTSFGGKGYVTFDDTGYEVGYGIAVDSKGKLFVTGRIKDGVDTSMILLRYRSDGTMESYFIFDSEGSAKGSDLTIDATGKVLVTGGLVVCLDLVCWNGRRDMAIWRFNN